MIKTLFLSMLMISSSWAKEPLRVAIIDTGLDPTDARFTHLCENGHIDLTGTGIKDTMGHGTFVAGLIQEYAGDANYCMIIIKLFDTKVVMEDTYGRGIKAAIDEKAALVNISGGGNRAEPGEYDLIRSNPQTMFVVAAGNWGADITGVEKFFPASYDLLNEVVVGSRGQMFRRSYFSNYGSIVTAWENGESVVGYSPTGLTTMSGTSMSTAIKTGKIINRWEK